MLNAAAGRSAHRAGLAAGLCLLAGLAQAQTSFTRGATPWPELPAPPKATVAWVSDDMRLNGIPMRVQRFDSQASKEEVVAYYVAYWKTPAVPVKPGETVAAVTTKGVDTLVARVHGPFYNMVKVRAAGAGSEGTLSTSQMLGVEPSLDTGGVPAPDNAQAVNVVEAFDNGKRNKQVLFVSRDSLDSVAAYYQQSLRSAGWLLIQDNSTPATGGNPPAIVRMYSRKQQQLDVALGVDVGNRVTVINANLVTQ